MSNTATENKTILYHPVIFFRAKCFAKTPIHVIFQKHYEATFPQTYKTQKGAINFARRQIDFDLDVWQLPAAKEIKAEETLNV